MPGRSAGLAVDSAAAALRDDIFRGLVRPGDRLDEVSLGSRLDVSRNTLREAFRVLAQQRLVVHEPNRGVFVRTIGAREAHEIYATRRIVECGAVREAAVLVLERRSGAGRGAASGAGNGAGGSLGDPIDDWSRRLAAVAAAVDAGRAAAVAEDWAAVGTANNAFHLALCELPGNGVLATIGAHLMTQMRLLFVDVAPAREVHERYVTANEQVLRLVEAGQLVRAAVALEDYLVRAEDHLVHSKPLS